MTATVPSQGTHTRAAIWLRRVRLTLAMVAGGLLLSCAFPNELLPGIWRDHPPAELGWLALLPFWWAVLTFEPRRARRCAWVYGLAFYAGTITWMRLMAPGALAGVPWALLSLYLSLTPWLAVWAAQRARLPRVWMPLVLAAAWAGLEWLRTQGPLAVSWSEVGATQVDRQTAWMAAVGGVPLITFIMLWLTGAVMLRVVDRASSRLMPVAAVVALVLAAALGVWQVGQTRGRWAAQPAMTVSVVQPSVLIGLTPEALVQGPSEGEVAEREQVLADLTRRAANAPSVPGAPHIIVWPESALERGSPEYRPDITRVASTPKTFLVAGGRHYVHSPASEGGFQARNGAFLFGPDGRQRDVYDKMHLVPFGEYVPLRPLVQRFFTVRSRDVVPGPTRRTLEADGRRLGVAICFESTFPAIARAYARSGAEVLVVMTNDAWFQRTSAVPQHFNHSRFRAIETGLPVARAASSGISGVIAPNGQVLAEIPVYQRGVRTLDLREGVPGTLNTAGGWLFGPGCLLAAVVLMVWGWRRREASTVATHPQAE